MENSYKMDINGWKLITENVYSKIIKPLVQFEVRGIRLENNYKMDGK